jgi:hypothetical protein
MTSFAWGALGALAVLLAAALLRRAAWRRFRRARFGPRAGVRILARRLDARPEQERVLEAEADALASEMARARADLAGVRAEIADLLGGPALDAAAVGAAIQARLARLEPVRAHLADAISRVHAALDPAQRARLADLVRSGPHRRRCAHA